MSDEAYTPDVNIVISDDSIPVDHDPSEIRPTESGTEIPVSATSHVVIDIDRPDDANSAVEVYKVVVNGNVAEVDVYYKVC